MEKRFISAFKEAMEMREKEIEMNDSFRDYEEWSSLKELSLLAMLDDEYGIEIEMKDFNKLITVKDMFEYVKSSAK